MQNLILSPVSVPELVDLIASEVEARINRYEFKEPPEDRIGLNEAIELTRISRSALYKLTMNGKVPHEKCRSRLIFSRKELQGWIDAQTFRKHSVEEVVSNQLQTVANKKYR